MKHLLTRRQFLQTPFSLPECLPLPACSARLTPTHRPPLRFRNQRYKIAVCDWMILKRQKLGAFQLTKDIGADGVEVDMGSLGKLDTFDNQLAKPEVRQQFLDAAKQLNLEICSLAMSGFLRAVLCRTPDRAAHGAGLHRHDERDEREGRVPAAGRARRPGQASGTAARHRSND